MSVHDQNLFVTGAAGHLGRRVAELLLEGAIGKVIAGTRDPAKIADLAAKGAEVRKADFSDPASLASAFQGVDRLLLISTDSLAPGQRLSQHKAAIDAAVKAGVKHVVYTSMLKPEPGCAVTFAPDHFGTEQALEKSGLAWTILRNSWYAENLLGSLPHALASGQWFTSAGAGRTAYIAREDIARAAAAALASTSAANARYDITGAKAMTNAEIAALAGEVFGKPIKVVPVDDAQLAAGLTAAGLPAMIVPMLVSFDVNTRQGGFDVVSDAAEKLSGRPPQSLRDFFVQHRAAFLPKA